MSFSFVSVKVSVNTVLPTLGSCSYLLINLYRSNSLIHVPFVAIIEEFFRSWNEEFEYSEYPHLTNKYYYLIIFPDRIEATSKVLTI